MSNARHASELRPSISDGSSVASADAAPLGAVADVMVGIAVNVAADGVTLELADDHAPCPTAFTAATRNVYPVPFDKPVTVALAAVDVPSLNVVHVDPLLELNCTA